MLLFKLALQLVSLWLLYPAEIQGAGVTMHLTVLARVVPEDWQAYFPWLKAGSFFPDSLYSCKPSKKLSQFAEATHWPPFLIDSINYWHEKYGQNSVTRSSQGSLRLQAFLLGTFTHQVVDSSWHSLVRGYRSHGLLRVLSETEFGGEIDDAHQFIDVMGEFIGLSNVLRDGQNSQWMYYTNANWSLPEREDIMELLYRNGLTDHDITFAELDICVKRGLSGSISEIYTFSKRRNQVLSVAYGISPRARDFMQECWLGGEFDLIAVLAKCLPVVEKMFEQSIGSKNMLKQLKVCGNLPPISSLGAIPDGLVRINRSSNPVFLTPVASLSAFGSSITTGRFKDDGQTYVAVGAPMEDSTGSIYLLPLHKIKSKDSHSNVMEPFTLMRGQRMNKFTYNGVDYLVVSEPGSNTFYFYHNDFLLLEIRDGSTADALQLQVSSIQDVDGDGIPDILLSGESYGINETGSVTIIFGANIAEYLENYHETARIDLSSLSTIRWQGGPLSLPYQHFGASVTSSHNYTEKGFLYVTCQNVGAVFVYSLCGLQNNILPKYVVMEKNIMLPDEETLSKLEKVTSKTHGMYGKTLYTFTYENENYVAISQHLFNQVFLYKESDGFLVYYLSLNLVADIEPIPFTVGFGAAIEYDPQKKLLYVSSPGSYSGKGAIWKISMVEMRETVSLWKSDKILVNTLKHLHMVNPLNEDKGVINFGKSLAVHQGNLLVGAPQYKYGNLNGAQLTGAVLL
ncbi:hypothetical protein HG535_0C00920 [Zygotorulaspora mrakii]|uniref:Phospholipase C/D domain-containing protein n=1 Tax=Zygotorulaspora mrakii TaxID=42260 RepID=A0A7H9AZT5_ZYGMR|nr:uncharacterized protein HG535_0C00920 [Zygotorulaspora mrakii]QLG71743.1 hypothetical protein HG535_0C00920 [Zygotorulaspora mrakii]